MGTARVELELTNAAGDDLNDFVRIELFSASTSDHFQNNVQVQRNVSVGGITVNATSVYRVVLTPSNYRLVQFFVMLTDGQTLAQKMAFPVDPARVTGVQAPAFGGLPAGVKDLLKQSEIPRFVNPDGSFRQGSDLYGDLDPVPKLKACLLNITTIAGRHHLSRPLWRDDPHGARPPVHSNPRRIARRGAEFAPVPQCFG